MIGEISIFGVFVPTLILIGLGALVLCGAVTMLLSSIGFYRFIVHRPIVDLAIFLLLLAALADASGIFGSMS
ncbi:MULTISPECIES: DUF1656 domain-containing protein [unclassified Sphingomonas]|jgi:hypothetical protein|uniref:DUF1656 domain-containing protein n=1 Tax=unclassified Sphingomonas TaxID=196159 RepID=UPI0009658774|nr:MULTISPECIES: DUF1656 domain-containing protein [unclassified Sphingomonas]MBN8812632.1 DUF1656 domain-containing protein [Sphingomonas sp.]OJY53597.1 MAG: DUF1656 domain-containing protein [Sphingomonas sp. 67-41]VVT18158.1 conserved hypothetical protein [Sphingomonas sp. EC-HK361]|tara:strand:+ start:2635 stop:2850 length:216 start_codon:yes stop_codon:yes gene_type:complete